MTDRLDESRETWGPQRVFEDDANPIACVLLFVGLIAFVVGAAVMGFAR